MTFQIKIDKNVALPTSGANAKYPFADLSIGDSFFAPGRTSAQISPCTAHAQRERGGKFTARTVTENGVKGVRVWRIE